MFVKEDDMYLIAGATGSLGGRVAKELLSRGERVRVLVRPQSPLRAVGRFTDPAELHDAGAEIVTGDLKAPETIEPYLEGVKAVLSTASGTKRAPPDTVEAVDLHGTQSLASSAKRAGVGHFVYLSTRGAGPDAPPFLRIKWLAENAVRGDGPPATLVRPAPFMQDWIGFVIGAQLQGGTRVQLVGDDDPSRAYVDESDVAKLLVGVLLEGPPSEGDAPRVIEFSADTALAGDVVSRLATVTGLPLTVERIPIGQAVDTVPEQIAPTLTELLTMVAHMESDTMVTPEVGRRYGFVPRTVDDYLSETFGGATA